MIGWGSDGSPDTSINAAIRYIKDMMARENEL